MTENFAKQITGAEIFATGTWNKLSFDEKALDAIVAAFAALGSAGKIPLKLGHEGPDARDNPASQYAMGWVSKIWREGRKLMADLSVPDKVHALISDGFLKFVSVELLKNVKASNGEIPWVLDAVALLGTDPPAVGILGDLQALTMSRSSASLPNGGRVTFARADGVQFSQPTGAKGSMSGDKTQTVEELLAKILEQQQQIADLQTEQNAAGRTKAEFTTVKSKLERLEAEVSANNIKAHRASLAAVLDAAIAEEDIVPAVRERFNRVHRVDDDEVVLSVTAEDVKEFIRANPNPLPRRKKKATTFTALDRVDGEVPAGTSADDETLLRAKALLASRGKHTFNDQDLVAAAKEVFTANAELAKRYKFMPDQNAAAMRGFN